MFSFANFLINLSRRKKLFVLVIADLCIAFFCWVVFGPPLSLLIATNFQTSLLELIYTNYISFLIPFSLAFFYLYLSGFYRSLMKFFDSKDSIFRAMIGAFIFGFSWGSVYLAQYEVIRTDYLTTVLLQSLLLSSVLYAFLQISRDIARLIIYPSKEKLNASPVLIYGAGAAGNELYQSIKNNPKIRIIGFYDNSFKLKGANINNIKIYGKPKHIKQLSEKHRGLEIYLAIPSLDIHERRKIISSLEKFKVAVRSMPALHEVVADHKKMAEIQDLSIDDVLPRSRVNKSNISFEGMSIMISGAGGSIGSEIVKQTLAGKPRKIVLFEISEINLYSVESEVIAIKNANNINTEIIGILGDIKDTNRVENIIDTHDVSYIYHAAAYKHVPIVEYYENITEGIKNNVFGTKSICEAAKNKKVKKVVVISTDKAVRPTNIMGASKRLAELCIQAISDSSKNIKTKTSIVRFGNVIGSSGSVIPKFKKQIRNGGPVTLTHPDVTRFFMSIPEAAQLVIQASGISKGNDLFVLDMGKPIIIRDLIKQIIKLSGLSIKDSNNPNGDIEITVTGLRSGEKLFEELLLGDNPTKTPHPKIHKVEDPFLSWELIKKDIDQLEYFLEKNKINKILKILKKLVTGFTPSNNVINLSKK